MYTKIKSWKETLGLLNNEIVQDQKKRRIDKMILIGGFEGSGKTNLALDLIEEFDGLKGIETPINHISLNLEQWFLNLADSPDGSILHLDEGKELAAQNWQKEEVKEFKRTITDLRYAGNIYLICFTNPADMIGYVRDDKVFMVLMVRRLGKKFLCYGYSRKVFAKILDDMDKKRIDTILSAKPNFICKIPEYKGRLLKPYMELKEKHVAAAKRRGAEKIKPKVKEEEVVLPNRKLIQPKEVIALTGFTHSQIQIAVAKGDLHAYHFAGSKSARYDLAEVQSLCKVYSGPERPELKNALRLGRVKKNSKLEQNKDNLKLDNDLDNKNISKMKRLELINKNLEGENT